MPIVEVSCLTSAFLTEGWKAIASLLFFLPAIDFGLLSRYSQND